jgi:hypothetical protein
MWLFARRGFVSIVKDRRDPLRFLVRARFNGDLTALFPGAKVSVTPDADYRFRASIPRADVAGHLTRHLLEIDYDNFKNAIVPRRLHDAATEVWTVMYRAQAQAVQPLKPIRPGRLDEPASYPPDRIAALRRAVGADRAFSWSDYPTLDELNDLLPLERPPHQPKKKNRKRRRNRCP